MRVVFFENKTLPIIEEKNLNKKNTYGNKYLVSYSKNESFVLHNGVFTYTFNLNRHEYSGAVGELDENGLPKIPFIEVVSVLGTCEDHEDKLMEELLDN
jgi:hypothetical protein